MFVSSIEKREGDISTEVAVQLLHTNPTILTNTRDNIGMHKQIGYSLTPSHIECALTYPLTPPNKEEMKEMCFEVCLNNLFVNTQ